MIGYGIRSMEKVMFYYLFKEIVILLLQGASAEHDISYSSAVRILTAQEFRPYKLAILH